MTNLKKDEWWDLHGPAIKAANTRAAAPVFASLADRFFDGPEERDVRLRSLAVGLRDFYAILYSNPRFMDAEAIDNIKAVTRKFGTGYQWLRAYCCDRGILAFPLTPKAHKMQHVPMLCEIMNARFVQCYSEESSIGTTTKIWSRSMVRRYSGSIQKCVLVKRLLGLFLRLEP